MRVLDYLRLGAAGMKAHKKRALVVVMIVGLLFGVVAAGAFFLQGLEQVALAEMLAPTEGKVLVMSSVDTRAYGEDCEVAAEVGKIKEKIGEYGGGVVPAAVRQTAEGMFYVVDEGVFGEVFSGVKAEASGEDEAMTVVVPLEVAAELAGIEMPESGASVAERMVAIYKVREETLGRTVESETGARYEVAGILPGGVYATDLSLVYAGQSGNPLNMLFGQVKTGVSQSFGVGAGDGLAEAEATGGELAEDVDAEAMGMVLAVFEDIEAAEGYYRDEVNYCAEVDRMMGRCSEEYRYQVAAAVADPLGTYDNLQQVWSVFKIAAAVLAAIAVLIALSTYVRLLGGDVKIIALYHAMGATGWQIRLVYLTYLVMLSALAVWFAVILGLGLAAGLSLVNMAALKEVFAMGFGVVTEEIWLVGWSEVIWWLVGALLVAAVLAVVLGNGNFAGKGLAKKMK